MNYVFIHGGGQGSWVWEETILALTALNPNHYCLALDVPGCGSKRGQDTLHLAFADIANELIADIETAGMSNIVLVGHSQAGTLLPTLAELRPDLFCHLVYITCSLPLPGQTVQAMIGDGVHGANEREVGWPVDPKTHSMAERTEVMMCNDMSESEAAEFMVRTGKDHWPACSFIETHWVFPCMGDVPATYIICLQDNILPVIWQSTFAERFRVKEIIRVDAGHQVMMTQPQTLADILHTDVSGW